MTRNMILAVAFAAILWPLQGAVVLAADDHGHEHQEEAAHEEDHDDHGHEEGHGHGEESHGEEGKAEISPQHAEKAGIKLAKAQGGMIYETIMLMGSIELNRDTTAKVRARFPGIVREVFVTLGEHVEKGKILARIESNESLNVYDLAAPVSGVVLRRNTNIGDVTGEEELFTIADLSNVWAKFHIFPKDAMRIKEGQDVRVHTLAEDVQTNAPIKLLLPIADELSQTYIAIVQLDNGKGEWRPGMTIEGDVAVSQKRVPVMVPKTALQTMEDQSVVFVMHDDAYEMRPVKTGASDAANIEILSGLQAGEEYAAQGSFIIKADLMKSGAEHVH